ncbi:MAG: pyridoxal-phosphate dependent enzyme, partial [Maribacter sp.]|nr:pyridoxal-phosphate dependent enzyme [Maribacter sp.]
MLSAYHPVNLPLLIDKKVSLSLKREDLLHTQISGNKLRKLKYNLIHAKELGFDTILTFGGAYSNHIAATAYAGKAHDLKTIGVIRGDELTEKWRTNPTLKLADELGMQFKFVSREVYRSKDNPEFINYLEHEFSRFYLLPEGGTNALAIKGCQEIISESDFDFDFICCPVGTGGTIAGIINGSYAKQTVLGFPALKGDFSMEDIRKFADKENWKIQPDYHFGGYAKVSEELINFINDFHQKTQIPLDPIY